MNLFVIRAGHAYFNIHSDFFQVSDSVLGDVQFAFILLSRTNLSGRTTSIKSFI